MSIYPAELNEQTTADDYNETLSAAVVGSLYLLEMHWLERYGEALTGELYLLQGNHIFPRHSQGFNLNKDSFDYEELEQRVDSALNASVVTYLKTMPNTHLTLQACEHAVANIKQAYETDLEEIKRRFAA